MTTPNKTPTVCTQVGNIPLQSDTKIPDPQGGSHTLDITRCMSFFLFKKGTAFFYVW